MKFELKEKAISLRREGLSYSEILKRIPVAKSTLSLWLRSVGLSKKQKQRLTEKKLAAMQRGWLKIRQIHLQKVKNIKDRARKETEQLIQEPLWLVGVMLYWGEGTKEKPWTRDAKVAFSNMDVETHRLFLSWVKKYLGVREVNLRYEFYIHETADFLKAKNFWIKNLNLPNNKLKVYFKRHNPKSIRKNTSDNYNGVLRIWVAKSTDLNRKIAGWIDGVVEYFK